MVSLSPGQRWKMCHRRSSIFISKLRKNPILVTNLQPVGEISNYCHLQIVNQKFLNKIHPQDQLYMLSRMCSFQKLLKIPVSHFPKDFIRNLLSHTPLKSSPTKIQFTSTPLSQFTLLSILVCTVIYTILSRVSDPEHG